MLRARMVTQIRRYLDERGFVEVETPILQPRYGGGVRAPVRDAPRTSSTRDLYLRIATELYLKRLIVGGLERVYELGKDFRNEGVSYKHNPEFTMLEWYEAYADYEDTMARDRGSRRDRRARDDRHDAGRRSAATTIDLAPPWRRLPFVESLEEHGLWTRDADELERRLARARRRHEPGPRRGRSSSTTRSRTSSSRRLIEPTIVLDYPVEISPVRAAEGRRLGTRRALRVLRRRHGARQRVQRARRPRRAGGAVRDVRRGIAEGEPGDPDYVEALSYGMPPTGGLGLGIDRLAMVLAGQDSIRDVILFPALRDE